MNGNSKNKQVEYIMKKLYYRFGDIPKSERSSIWRGEIKIGEEKGVSVYETHKNLDGTYVPILPYPPTEKCLNDYYYYLRYYNGDRYLVTGNLLDERGSDGEPLLNDVKVIEKLFH